MLSEFDICGTHIPYEKIKDYKIVQREYIFRPTFREKTSFLGFKRKNTEGESNYEFDSMQPYAMILEKDDMNFKLATKNVLTTALGLTIVKDVAVGALTIAKEKINRKRFRCQNIAGRCFTTFLGDIPSVLYTNDGRVVDVYNNDPMHIKLGQNIAPSIQMVPALLIKTKDEEFFFFGNNIQLPNVDTEYVRLRYDMELLKLEASKTDSLESKGNFFKKFLPKKKGQPKLVDSNPETVIEKANKE